MQDRSFHYAHQNPRDFLELNLLIALLIVIGTFSWFFYYMLWKYFQKHSQNVIAKDSTISLKESLLVSFQSPPLRLLSWIVIADYIAYSLGEVIFLDVAKLRFPDANDYCNYMGSLALWTGILTFISSLFITPFILKRCRWVVASLITPFCLLITEGLFFIFLRGKATSCMWFGWTETEWVGVALFLGSLQYCLCRGAKYTLFDSSKELAFILLPDFQRMKGKLVVDGISARVGRGGAAILSMSLIKLSGGVIASAYLSGFIAIGMALSWLISTFKLGKLVEAETVKKENALEEA